MSPKSGSKVAQLRKMREDSVEVGKLPPEEFYAERVTASLRKTTEGFIEAGRWLVEAREEIEHGKWEAWVKDTLPISMTSVKRLMTIARGLANRPHLDALPPAETTLYDLARLEDEEFEKVRPILTPETTRAEVRKALSDEKPEEKKEPVKEDTPPEIHLGSALKSLEKASPLIPEDSKVRMRVDAMISELPKLVGRLQSGEEG